MTKNKASGEEEMLKEAVWLLALLADNPDIYDRSEEYASRYDTFRIKVDAWNEAHGIKDE